MNGMCQSELLDADGDGYPPTSCNPNGDCNDFDPDVHPGHAEVCGDGSDNDCNGVTDCFDPGLRRREGLRLQAEPDGELCMNGKDDDCDGFVDCFDGDCAGTPVCTCGDHESGHCVNGFDDDCDGQIDCDDAECSPIRLASAKGKVSSAATGKTTTAIISSIAPVPDCTGIGPCTVSRPACRKAVPTARTTTCDGKVDCADPDCLVSPACKQCTAEVCNDGNDNNCDGKIDCAYSACAFDPSCAPSPRSATITKTTTTTCSSTATTPTASKTRFAR